MTRTKICIASQTKSLPRTAASEGFLDIECTGGLFYACLLLSDTVFCFVRYNWRFRYMYMLMHVTARYFLLANYLNKLQLLENIFENVVSQNISNFDNGTYFVWLTCKGWPAIGRPIFSQWRVGVLWRFYNDFIRSLLNRRILT